MKPEPSEILEVPIVKDFDHSQPIGMLRIRRDALPPTPEFKFSIGFIAKTIENGKPTDYSLVVVSLVPDPEPAVQLVA